MRWTRIVEQVFGLIFISSIFAGGTWFFHPHRPLFYQAQAPLMQGEITLEQVVARFGNNVLWIDARSQREYQAETIPGALYLGASDFDHQLEEHWLSLQDEKRPVVVFCSQQACKASQEVRKKLMEALPLLEIYALRGGWQTWQQAKNQAGYSK